MTLELTDRNSLVTQALVDLLKAKWEKIGCQQRDDIYYSDQEHYPRYPSLAVEGGNQERELNQTGLQERIHFTMFILIVHGPLKGASVRRAEIDAIAENVVGFIHMDRRLGGLVIHGSITDVEPGYAVRGGALQIVHRLTWTGISNNFIGL